MNLSKYTTSKRLKTMVFLFVSTVLISVAPLSAQKSSVLTLKITDTNKAEISGAEVVLKRRDVRFERTAATRNDGISEFLNLAAGGYTITVSAKNFGTITKSIVFDSTETIEIQLSPQAIVEEVSVTANSLAGTPESLSEIPGSIERVDSQTLENARVFNFLYP